jgi:hypothetical protein
MSEEGDDDVCSETLLNTTNEIAAGEVDKEAGIPYSCPAQHRHKYHNNDVG